MPGFDVPETFCRSGRRHALDSPFKTLPFSRLREVTLRNCNVGKWRARVNGERRVVILGATSDVQRVRAAYSLLVAF